jgi:hypothetical protein
LNAELRIKRVHLILASHCSEYLEFETSDREELYPVLADVALYNHDLLERHISDRRCIATTTYLPEHDGRGSGFFSCLRTQENGAFLEALVFRYGEGATYDSLPLGHSVLAGKGART